MPTAWTGTTLPAKFTSDELAHFETKYTRGVPDVCWFWEAGKDKDGYGCFWVQGHLQRAHRVAYRMAGGRLSAKHPCVLHDCDTPACVNPGHLQAGTSQRNTAEREVRERTCRGTQHRLAKLTDDIVREARVAYASGVTGRSLARHHGVAQAVMWNALNGRTWKHVEVSA